MQFAQRGQTGGTGRSERAHRQRRRDEGHAPRLEPDQTGKTRRLGFEVSNNAETKRQRGGARQRCRRSVATVGDVRCSRGIFEHTLERLQCSQHVDGRGRLGRA